jgi:hypothetical protein
MVTAPGVILEVVLLQTLKLAVLRVTQGMIVSIPAVAGM